MRAANSHFGKHYINGVWTTPKGAMIDVENPATREIFVFRTVRPKRWMPPSQRLKAHFPVGAVRRSRSASR